MELIGGLAGGAVVTMKLLPFSHELTLGMALFDYWLYLVIALGLIAAAAIDLEHMILPDSITLGGTILGLLTSPIRFEVDPLMSILGAAGGFLGLWFPFIWVHEKLRGFPGMGLGDAKLLALAGAWFGPVGALLTLFFGAIQGTIFAVITLALTGRIEEPKAVTEQRNELLAAIDAAEGEEKQQLIRELEADPLGRAPDEAEGGPRIAFGPFLVLALLELLLFFHPIETILHERLYL